VILAGRAVVALASILAVIVAWRLGVLIGGPATGLIAMLLTAVAPALVVRSSNVIVDSVATLFALLSLYFAERLRRRWSADAQIPWREAAFAAAATAGLALSSKYTVGAVFSAVAVSIALSPGRFGARARCLAFAAAGAGLRQS
jgi:4-amino-4-deoxy-L-arabinose transferase-like glycosyltransferase